MESSGKPGMVHISEKTYEFLKDQYFVQAGEEVGGKSYADKLSIGSFYFKCVIVSVEKIITNVLRFCIFGELSA